VPAEVASLPLVSHLQAGRRCNRVLSTMDMYWPRDPDTESFASAVDYVSVEAIGGSR
jgi:hypothetical protein